jgi:5-methylthioadenosine/S-adenosylhomocysteine deaminase
MTALFLARALVTPQGLWDGGAHGIAIACDDNGHITAIGPAAETRLAAPTARATDYSDLILLPGLVNAHTHSFQTLLRGITDDRPFSQWRDLYYRLTPTLSPSEVYDGALLTFAEMLLRGVTTVCDFFPIHHGGIEYDHAVLRAARHLGIRCTLARSLIDSPRPPAAYQESVEQAIANTRTLAADLQGNPLLRVMPAPHSPHNCSPEMLRAAVALAEELDTPWHMHLAESGFDAEVTMQNYGMRPLPWLDSLGLLSDRSNIVHGIQLTPEEISRLGECGVGLIYCPSSNMFLGHGFVDLPRYRAAGVRVALGSDGANSNNRAGIFDEMRMAVLAQRNAPHHGPAPDARDVFSMGTEGGAAALGLHVGALEVGRPADFIAIDPQDLSLQPSTDLLRNLIYSFDSSAVRNVVVNGVEVLRERVHIRGTAALHGLRGRLHKLIQRWQREGLWDGPRG